MYLSIRQSRSNPEAKMRKLAMVLSMILLMPALLAALCRTRRASRWAIPSVIQIVDSVERCRSTVTGQRGG